MPKGVYKRTAEHIAICRKAGAASAVSDVNKKRYEKRWEIKKCLNCGNDFNSRVALKRKYCCLDCANHCPTRVAKVKKYLNKGNKNIPDAETRKKMSMAKIGKHISPGTEFKRQPGTTDKKYQRTCNKNAIWRRAVFERDDYTCQFCGVRGGVLHADHIKPFSIFPALRFELSNGRTLCKKCHEKTPTYKKNQFQLRKMFEKELNE